MVASFFVKLVVFQLPPTLHHFGHVLGLVAKTGLILQSVRLGAGNESMLGIVEHQMGNVGVRTEDSIESFGAGVARRGNSLRTSSASPYALWLICFSEIARTWRKSR